MSIIGEFWEERYYKLLEKNEQLVLESSILKAENRDLMELYNEVLKVVNEYKREVNRLEKLVHY